MVIWVIIGPKQHILGVSVVEKTKTPSIKNSERDIRFTPWYVRYSTDCLGQL